MKIIRTIIGLLCMAICAMQAFGQTDKVAPGKVYDIAIGDGVWSGNSYNFCVGKSCNDGQDCQIEIASNVSFDALLKDHLEEYDYDRLNSLINFARKVIAKQDAHCGHNSRRLDALFRFASSIPKSLSHPKKAGGK